MKDINRTRMRCNNYFFVPSSRLLNKLHALLRHLKQLLFRLLKLLFRLLKLLRGRLDKLLSKQLLKLLNTSLCTNCR